MSEDLTQDREAGYRALRGDGGLVRLDRDLVTVVGPQATEFLQGQLSQDVAAMAPGTSLMSFVLQPSGKVDAWFRIGPIDNGFAIDVAAPFGETVRTRLERFKLRTKADIELLDTTPTPRAIRAARQGGPGVDILRPATDGLQFAEGELPEVGLDAYEAVRIECGVPKVGAELTESTIPAEAGQWIIEQSVSFSKGCYTGQELVARIDSRGGNVPRHLRGVVVTGDDVPPVGATIECDGGAVGALTSVARSPQLGPIALAYIARKVEPPADVTIRWDAGHAPARVDSVPLI